MNTRIKFLVAAVGAVTLAGCVVRPIGHGRAVIAPAPLVAAAVVAGAITHSVVNGVTYYSDAPPAAPYENMGYAPSAGMVWTPGYHYWGGSGYVWRGGYWAAPPVGYRSWSPGYWSRGAHGHHWVGGHWRR